MKVGGGEKDGFSILANSTTWNAKPYDITSTVARMFFKALINLAFILVAAKLSSHGRVTEEWSGGSNLRSQYMWLSAQS